MLKQLEAAAHLCGLHGEMLSSSRELFFIEEFGFEAKCLVARAGKQVVFAHICTDDEAEITAFDDFLTELEKVCGERYWEPRSGTPFSHMSYKKDWSRFGFRSRGTRAPRMVREIYITLASNSEFEAFVLERKPFNWATLSRREGGHNGIWMSNIGEVVTTSTPTAANAQGKHALALLEHLVLKITNRPSEEALPQIMGCMAKIGHTQGGVNLSANELLRALLHHSQRGLTLSKTQADRFRAICIATDPEIVGLPPIGEGKGVKRIMREAGIKV